MKKSRVVLSLAAGLLVAALIIIALLPSIVSSDMMKPVVIRTVNRQLPGQLQLESWSVSWFGGIEGQGIVYDNQTDGFLAQVSEIKSERDTLILIWISPIPKPNI
jgi:autotransporter translocation and assembly factor TamB